MNEPSRVLMLGLDAADCDVVLQLVHAGRLPTIAALMRKGTTGRLDSPAGLYAGGVWPTFYTGRPVAEHGVYHNKQWRPEHMRVEVPTHEWTQALPFWDAWKDADIDALIVDVPMVLGRPTPMRGVYLGGWGTHDLIARGSWPASLWGDLERRFGAPRMPREGFGKQSHASLDALALQLRESLQQMRDIAIHLLERQAWRFACIVFGAAHRGGHYLWDRSQAGSGDAPSPTPHESLLRIYEELDAAVGKVLLHVPDETLVVVFAVHGMGPNPGWSDLLPDVLAQLAQARGETAPPQGLLFRLKQALPYHWLRPLLNAMPTSFNQRLVELWSGGMYDWARTQHFGMPMDEAAYLRVNLSGRERDGIVAPEDYPRLCSDLETLVTGLYDATSGASIAGRAAREYTAAAGRYASARLVPDLVVPWDGPAATATRCLRSHSVPGFSFDVPSQLPSGRSGNHRGSGWFTACGPGVPQGAELHGHDVMDLLPTVLARLGRADEARRLPGRVMIELAEP